MEEEDVTGSSDTEKFDLYDINMETQNEKNRTSELLHQWSKNREEVISGIFDIVNKLNEWHKICSISTTVCSSTSLIGRVALLGGLFIPPVAVAGAVIGAVASTSNIATNIAKYIHIKKMIEQVSRLIESDEELSRQFLGSYHKWIEYAEKAGNHKGRSKGHFRTFPFTMTIQKGWIATLLARLLIIFSKPTTSRVIKGVAHAYALTGIAMDIASLVSDVKELSSGAKSDLDSELREAAEKLEIERMEILRTALIELL